MEVALVALVALGTAFATGLGALPFALFKGTSERGLGLSSAVAAGTMLGASGGLFYEGAITEAALTLLGALVGVLFILGARALLKDREHIQIGQLTSGRSLDALILIGVMTVHSVTEGAAIGVSFAGLESLGWVISIAMAIHNIPEGVAISLSLVPHGESVAKAAAWSIFSSLPQPLMAVPAYLAVKAFEPLLPAGLGFAGGAMVWMVLTQMIPEVRRTLPGSTAMLCLGAGALVMAVLQILIGF